MRVTEAERLEAIGLVRKIYDILGGEAGCCLHVIIDDGNTDDSMVNTKGWDEPGCIEHDDCRRLLELLRKMKRAQRNKVIDSGKGRHHER